MEDHQTLTVNMYFLVLLVCRSSNTFIIVSIFCMFGFLRHYADQAGLELAGCSHVRSPEPFILIGILSIFGISEQRHLYCHLYFLYFWYFETLGRPCGPWAGRGPPAAPSVSKCTTKQQIQIKLKVLLLRHTKHSKESNSNAGFGDLTWLRASQLDARLVCIVSNTKKQKHQSR